MTAPLGDQLVQPLPVAADDWWAARVILLPAAAQHPAAWAVGSAQKFAESFAGRSRTLAQPWSRLLDRRRPVLSGSLLCGG